MKGKLVTEACNIPVHTDICGLFGEPHSEAMMISFQWLLRQTEMKELEQ